MSNHEANQDNSKNKGSVRSAWGLIIIIVILIIAAANYIRIQQPRFQNPEKTIQEDAEKASGEGSSTFILQTKSAIESGFALIRTA